MKTAEEILPALEIDACFPADCRIHLSQERCRDLQHRNPAHKDGGQETCDVRNNPAAETDDYTGAVCPRIHHPGGQFLYPRKPLVYLAAWKEQQFKSTVA